MSPKLLKRHVDWSAAAASWHTFLAECDKDPALAFTWIEENLSGPWSHRILSAKEYEAEFGLPYDGQLVLVFGIKDSADADKLYAHFAPPAGSA
jgi:hypothetical protein